MVSVYVIKVLVMWELLPHVKNVKGIQKLFPETVTTIIVVTAQVLLAKFGAAGLPAAMANNIKPA
jgi:hypothetical protein